MIRNSQEQKWGGPRCAAASFRSRHTARRGYAGREQFPLLLQFFDPTGFRNTAKSCRLAHPRVGNERFNVRRAPLKHRAAVSRSGMRVGGAVRLENPARPHALGARPSSPRDEIRESRCPIGRKVVTGNWGLRFHLFQDLRSIVVLGHAPRSARKAYWVVLANTRPARWHHRLVRGDPHGQGNARKRARHARVRSELLERAARLLRCPTGS